MQDAVVMEEKCMDEQAGFRALRSTYGDLSIAFLQRAQGYKNKPLAWGISRLICTWRVGALFVALALWLSNSYIKKKKKM